jgi:6-phosphofructokinase 1
MSATDHAQAVAVGQAAVAYALAGQDGMMPAIRRLGEAPYRWDIVPVAAAAIANLERRLPAAFIADDRMHLSELGRRSLRPLIVGEITVPCVDGLPEHYLVAPDLLPRRLPPWSG